jgi:hypothetical protein
MVGDSLGITFVKLTGDLMAYLSIQITICIFCFQLNTTTQIQAASSL